MDTAPETVVVPKQPLFIGCNEKKLIDRILAITDEFNDKYKQEVKPAIMSNATYMSSLQDWLRHQPDYVKQVKDTQTDEMFIAKRQSQAIIRALSFQNLPSFTQAMFRDAYNERSREKMSHSNAEKHIDQMLVCGAISCLDQTLPRLDRRYTAVITKDDEIEAIKAKIEMKLQGIDYMQKEVAELQAKLEAKQAEPDEATEEPTGTKIIEMPQPSAEQLDGE